MVLVLVLLAVMLLSCAAYFFAERMLVEAEAANLHARQAQARAWADSGVESVLALLDRQRRGSLLPLDDQPAQFRSIQVDETGPFGPGFFSVLYPRELGAVANERFGLADESARLNLHSLPLGKEGAVLARRRLLALPGMTPAIADAILDWLDEDDEPRAQGAERSYYSSLNPPYQPRNGPLNTLDELLSVRGVTPALLYGEGGHTTSDGRAPAPWVKLLTLHSAESNLQPDGRPKINLNDPDLAGLFDATAAQLGVEAAQFMIAYRLFGPHERPPSDPEDPDEVAAAALRRAAQQLGKAESNSREGQLPPDRRSRGGFDLTRRSTHRISSVGDLLGARVQAILNSEDKLLASPWSADPSKIERSLSELESVMTVTAGLALAGRINIQYAPREVLLTIPHLTPQMASAIMALRETVGADSAAADARPTTAWLLRRRVLDLALWQKVSPYITARGDVYRAEVRGHFARSPVVARVEVMVDATTSPPRVVQHRDMSPWQESDEP